jgi:hypothetical protein
MDTTMQRIRLALYVVMVMTLALSVYHGVMTLAVL